MIAVNIHPAFSWRHLENGVTAKAAVINIGSSNSELDPYPGVAAYSLTKGAVAAFTRKVSRATWVHRGITSQAINPTGDAGNESG